MTDQKNMLLAIVLSAIVLVAWQYFVGMPQMEKQRQQQQAQQQAQKQHSRRRQRPSPARLRRRDSRAPGTPGARPAGRAASPVRPISPTGQVFTREAVLAAGPRIAIETPLMKGSIALKGARIDDLALTQYRETVDPKSPAIVLLSPAGTEHPFYAEFGWVPGAGVTAKLPERRDRVASGRRGHALARQAGHARLGQWRGARIPPHHRGRRQVSVHRQGRGDEQGRRADHAVPLCV